MGRERGREGEGGREGYRRYYIIKQNKVCASAQTHLQQLRHEGEVLRCLDAAVATTFLGVLLEREARQRGLREAKCTFIGCHDNPATINTLQTCLVHH